MIKKLLNQFLRRDLCLSPRFHFKYRLVLSVAEGGNVLFFSVIKICNVPCTILDTLMAEKYKYSNFTIITHTILTKI